MEEGSKDKIVRSLKCYIKDCLYPRERDKHLKFLSTAA